MRRQRPICPLANDDKLKKVTHGVSRPPICGGLRTGVATAVLRYLRLLSLGAAVGLVVALVAGWL